MQRHTDNHPSSRVSSSSETSTSVLPESVGSEAIHIRNYDHQYGYDLSIEAVDTHGDVVFAKRYYVQAGYEECEHDVLPSGDYLLRATLDNLQEAELDCRVDAAPEHTAVVEIGNGALSLTEGLQG